MSKPTFAPRPVNAFEFVTIAAARSRQLVKGCTPRVDGSPKPARRAQQEVTQGTVTKNPPSTD